MAPHSFCRAVFHGDNWAAYLLWQLIYLHIACVNHLELRFVRDEVINWLYLADDGQ